MRIRYLTMIAAIVASVASVAMVQPSGATYEDPDVCQKPANPPKNATLIKGTAGSDVIHGTSGNDIIRGVAGSDIIFGGGGNDMICGGLGNDIIHGEAGNDRAWGNLGEDWFDGGPGDDQFNGGQDGDTISFASAAAPVRVDTAKSAYWIGNGPQEKLAAVYRIVGSKFDDTIDVDDAKESKAHEVRAGAGHDRIIYDDNRDNVYGEAGENKCSIDNGQSWFACRWQWYNG